MTVNTNAVRSTVNTDVVCCTQPRGLFCDKRTYSYMSTG
jgi:hypothetical protein